MNERGTQDRQRWPPVQPLSAEIPPHDWKQHQQPQQPLPIGPISVHIRHTPCMSYVDFNCGYCQIESTRR